MKCVFLSLLVLYLNLESSKKKGQNCEAFDFCGDENAAFSPYEIIVSDVSDASLKRSEINKSHAQTARSNNLSRKNKIKNKLDHSNELKNSKTDKMSKDNKNSRFLAEDSKEESKKKLSSSKSRTPSKALPVKCSQAQKELIYAKHKELAKKSYGDMYCISNEFGVFSVSVQSHFKYDKIGLATFYIDGELTSTGEKFNRNYYTAAHATLPIPCVAEVSDTQNPSKKIIVKINDRGPLVKNPNVILDLTKKGADELNFVRAGMLEVRIKVLIHETMRLKEHGGDLDWDGSVPFTEAIKNKKYRTKASKKAKKDKDKKYYRIFKKRRKRNKKLSVWF